METASEPARGNLPVTPVGPGLSWPPHNDHLLPTSTQSRDGSTTLFTQRTPYLEAHVVNHSGETPLLVESESIQTQVQVEDYFTPSNDTQSLGHGEDTTENESSVRQDAHVSNAIEGESLASSQLVAQLTTIEDLEPIPQPPGSAPLSFRPLLLQPSMGIASMMLYLIVGASIGVLWWRTSVIGTTFRVSDQNIQLLARYLPTASGTVTFLVFRTTCTEAIRMMPYINMADQQENTVGKGLFAKDTVAGTFYPWRALWPAGHTPLSFITLVSFSSMIVIPWLVAAKSTLISVVLVENHWEITVQRQQAIVLICSYAGMFLSTAVITIWFWNRKTGLRWDPVSLADTIALFASCNALEDFAPLESQLNTPAARDATLAMKRFRIGYWRSRGASLKQANIVYGIGSTDHKSKSTTPFSSRSEPDVCYVS
jgi:hypothetical protein